VARGALDEAARALRDLLSRVPDDVEGHVLRGELARRRGAFSEALAAYRTIVDLAAAGATVSEERLDEARRYSRALPLLLGATDPVTAGPCTTRTRRALAGC
jgi:predicted Zn-dependent protease